MLQQRDVNKLTFVVDIDGTLCPIKKSEESYADLVPYPQILTKLQQMHEQGAYIILYTSRNMNSYSGNIGMINVNTAPILLEWIRKWNIPCDELVYGKVWPGHYGFYIDDRAVRPDEFLKYTPDELKKICNSSREDTYNA